MTQSTGGFCFMHNRFHSTGCECCWLEEQKIREVEEKLDKTPTKKYSEYSSYWDVVVPPPDTAV